MPMQAEARRTSQGHGSTGALQAHYRLAGSFFAAPCSTAFRLPPAAHRHFNPSAVNSAVANHSQQLLATTLQRFSSCGRKINSSGANCGRRLCTSTNGMQAGQGSAAVLLTVQAAEIRRVSGKGLHQQVVGQGAFTISAVDKPAPQQQRQGSASPAAQHAARPPAPAPAVPAQPTRQLRKGTPDGQYDSDSSEGGDSGSCSIVASVGSFSWELLPASQTLKVCCRIVVAGALPAAARLVSHLALRGSPSCLCSPSGG